MSKSQVKVGGGGMRSTERPSSFAEYISFFTSVVL